MEEWKGVSGQALRTWAQALVVVFHAHGEQELGVDFLEALQGNVEAKHRAHSEQGKSRS